MKKLICVFISFMFSFMFNFGTLCFAGKTGVRSKTFRQSYSMNERNRLNREKKTEQKIKGKIVKAKNKKYQTNKV